MVLKIACLLLFQSDRLQSIAAYILFAAGLWLILKKCGAKGWKALIPCYRYVALGECVGREPEGNTLFCLELLSTVTILAATLLPESSAYSDPIMLISLIVGVTDGVFLIRIYMGLIELFGRKKKWIVLWFFVEWFCALYWGISEKYQPRWQIADLEKRAEKFFKGENADIMDEGLTVNLEERTVHEQFRKKYLLRDIHMYVKPGSMVLLLGGSGAGKTTYVNAVIGYEKANAEVILNGKNVYRDYDEMKYQVGFVPQQDLMRGNDTVERTMLDAAALRLPIEFTAEERHTRVESVMEIFGLLPVRNSPVEKLSGGQRKRLSIAMEFISNPTLFVLDEPDSGLDGVMARELMLQLRKIADQGKIVVVITHTPDRVIDLFDDVIVLAKDENRTGRLAFYGPILEARKFFGEEKMEEIVKSVNRSEEGGKGLADMFIRKYAEAHHG